MSKPQYGHIGIIERLERPGKKPHVGETTKKQLMIYNAMGVAPPG